MASTATKICSGNNGTLGINCTVIEYQIPGSGLSLVLQNGSLPTPLADQGNGGTVYSLIQSVASPAKPNGPKAPQLFYFAVAQLLAGYTGTDSISELENASWNVTSCSLEWCAQVYKGLEVVSAVPMCLY